MPIARSESSARSCSALARSHRLGLSLGMARSRSVVLSDLVARSRGLVLSRIVARSRSMVLSDLMALALLTLVLLRLDGSLCSSDASP